MDDLVAILHVTHIDNLDKILSTKYLAPKYYLSANKIKYTRGDQFLDMDENLHAEFPGVFCSLISKNYINQRWPPKSIGNIANPMKDYVTLVFSIVLLRQKNWHFNRIDNMGYIDRNTFTYKSLNDIIDIVKKDDIAKSPNQGEVIFHDKISIEALQEIWTGDKEIAEKYANVRYVTNVPDKIYNKYNDLTDSDPLLNKIIDMKQSPNFCYIPGRSYYESNQREKSAENFYQVARNCGISNDNIYDYMVEIVSRNHSSNPEAVFYPQSNWFLFRSTGNNGEYNIIKDAIMSYESGNIILEVFISNAKERYKRYLKTMTPQIRKQLEYIINSPSISFELANLINETDKLMIHHEFE